MLVVTGKRCCLKKLKMENANVREGGSILTDESVHVKDPMEGVDLSEG